MVTISVIICAYYNVIVCYTVFFMASTFQKTVPWAVCPAYPENITKCHVRNEEVRKFITSLILLYFLMYRIVIKFCLFVWKQLASEINEWNKTGFST